MYFKEESTQKCSSMASRASKKDRQIHFSKSFCYCGCEGSGSTLHGGGPRDFCRWKCVVSDAVARFCGSCDFLLASFLLQLALIFSFQQQTQRNCTVTHHPLTAACASFFSQGEEFLVREQTRALSWKDC